MVEEKRVGVEYLEYARELKNSVTKWMEIGIAEIAKEYMVA